MSTRPDPDGIDRLIAAIPHASWFAALGSALEPSEEADLAAYTRSLALEPARVALVTDWAEAARIASDPDWDQRWWDAEERLRRALQAQASDAHGEITVMQQLSAVAQAAHDATLGPAAMAAARSGVADQALSRAAAGAAAQACYHAGLALVAGETRPEHAFHAKLRLFQAGRWPLGIVRGSAYIF